MLLALALASSLASQPNVPPPPPTRMIRMHVGDERVLLMTERPISRWSALVRGSSIAIDDALPTRDHRHLRVAIHARSAGVSALSVCLGNDPEIWLVEVLP